MAEQSSDNKYINCSRCKCKYINDDEHIKNDFGFTRLGKRLSTCTKCREKRKGDCKQCYEEHKDYHKQYYQDNKDNIMKRREQLKKDADASNGAILYCNRCYTNLSFGDFVCPNGKTYGACYGCLKQRYG